MSSCFFFEKHYEKQPNLLCHLMRDKSTIQSVHSSSGLQDPFTGFESSLRLKSFDPSSSFFSCHRQDSPCYGVNYPMNSQKTTYQFLLNVLPQIPSSSLTKSSSLSSLQQTSNLPSRSTSFQHPSCGSPLMHNATHVWMPFSQVSPSLEGLTENGPHILLKTFTNSSFNKVREDDPLLSCDTVEKEHILRHLRQENKDNSTPSFQTHESFFSRHTTPEAQEKSCHGKQVDVNVLKNGKSFCFNGPLDTLDVSYANTGNCSQCTPTSSGSSHFVARDAYTHHLISEDCTRNPLDHSNLNSSNTSLFSSLEHSDEARTFSRRSRAQTSPAVSNPLTQNFFNDLHLNIDRMGIYHHYNNQLLNTKSSCYLDDSFGICLDGLTQQVSFLDEKDHETSYLDDGNKFDARFNSAMILSNLSCRYEDLSNYFGSLSEEPVLTSSRSKSLCPLQPRFSSEHKRFRESCVSGSQTYTSPIDQTTLLETPWSNAMESFYPNSKTSLSTRSPQLHASADFYSSSVPSLFPLSTTLHNSHDQVPAHSHADRLMKILSSDSSNFSSDHLASEFLDYNTFHEKIGLSVLAPSHQSNNSTLLPCTDVQKSHQKQQDQLHMEKRCKPCAFFYNQKKTCRNGESCSFCHHQDHATLAIKQWKKLNLRLQRTEHQSTQNTQQVFLTQNA